jgi:uncharacterized membrane protein YsdA (DUF1294 family)/cold shock CspA family protein
MRYQGKITDWKDDRGYGFITPNIGGEPVFVHIKAFKTRQRRPAIEQIVTFEMASDGKGRPQASQVSHVLSSEARQRAVVRAAGPSRLPLIIAGLFLAFVATGALTGKFPPALLWLYASASLVTFMAYRIDKSAAENGRWRTPEKTLHLLALIGGWPGALVAQNRLRHKSSKASFLLTFWITVVLNCGGLGWLLSASGQPLRQTLHGLA